MKTYITYGQGNKFIPELLPDKSYIRNPKNSINKPNNCWWGSPIDAEYGWKQWCESNEYDEELVKDDADRIYWTLSEDAKVLEINTLDDLIKVPYLEKDKEDSYAYSPSIIDFEKICRDYDAVELTNSCIGHYFINDKEIAFNAWDCESIVVLNKDKIIPIT